MSVRSSHAVALLLALGALAGCSGGSSGTAQLSFDCGTAGAKTICIQNCNLGCSETGCSRTDIAQNQIVILQFSEAIDPNSVNSSSIRFRTASGDQPIGELLVNGNQVEFVPTLSISGGQTFFGFSAGETYTMTIPGGADQPNVVRSLSGKPFDKTLTCTLQSTLGIVDLNGVAPRATMVSPSSVQVGSAPRNTEIVLEFNEMIDATPFLSGTQSPVTFSVRRNRIATGGGYECDPNSAPQTLGGTQALDFDVSRGISILTFRPVQELPGNICVEINVTDGVADLSGRPAQPQTFTFRTVVVPLVEESKVEEFDSNTQLETEFSAATWANGQCSFARIGGDGRHGPFSLALATNTNTTQDGKLVYQFNTDNTIIPASNTSTGSPIAITDGRFFFTQMVVPSNVKLKFIGSRPPVITVAGRFDVLGDIDVSGTGITLQPTVGSTLGQAGAPGGIFAGAGGKGGDKISQTQASTTGAQIQHQGVRGENARMISGHGYASSLLNSGGAGSTVFPTTGLSAHLYYGSTAVPSYCVSAAAGGAGGGFLVAGAPGRVVSNNHSDLAFTGTSVGATATTLVAAPVPAWLANRFTGRTVTITSGPGTGESRTVLFNSATTLTVSPAWTTPPTASGFTIAAQAQPSTNQMGPQASGGVALQLFPFPAPSGTITRSSEFFLIGGSGGGGGASHAALAMNATADKFAVGCGGGGGGGAVALRAGDLLRIGPAGRVLAKGGSAANSTGTAAIAQPTPGGGGSGGSIVLQAGRTVDLTGQIDVRGGLGGVFNRTAGTAGGASPSGVVLQIAGGDGSAGFVRLETGEGATLSQLGTMQPAPVADNIGPLNERDDLVVCQSKWYSTNLIFGPEFARYEIRGTVDGVPFLLSDDPAVSTQAATIGAPVRALFQGAQLDLSTQVPVQIAPWRTSVRSSPTQTGIASDGLNGFRFQLFADYTVGQVITIDQIVIVYRV
ncbi:MAG: Ig-like domain-containing protein [Planctomycetes bacterium]|nr:Ig-like domain-containing protein [Planctomycetota bacterium]